jgi:hypothetical protein
VDWDVSCFVGVSALIDWTVISAGTAGTSVTVTGAGMFNGFIGLAGLTGLLTFVGFN